MRVKLILGVAAAGVVLAGGAWLAVREPAKADGPPAQPPAVPVTADMVRQQDVPVLRTGLGTVQGFNTVTVHTRIDGEITKVGFTEGQDVKAGDLLMQIDPRPLQAQLAQADAQKAKDEAQLVDAKLQLGRFTNLAQRDFATKQSVDTQTASVHQLEAAIKGDAAAIDNAKTQLSYTTITAPISGRTGLRLVDQGNIVHASDQTGLVVIAQVKPIAVVFTLAENMLSTVVKARAGGPLKVQAWNQEDTEKLDDGTLTLIDNQIDQTTGTMKLKATFENASDTLWPGQFVNVHLLIETRKDGVTVPAQTVQRSQSGTFAWVIKPDTTVEMRPITVAQINGGVALVDKGLTVGEKVVVDGQYKLKPGIKVAATPVAGTAQAANTPPPATPPGNAPPAAPGTPPAAGAGETPK
jgi:multidrug efflux system membrane fusion protein